MRNEIKLSFRWSTTPLKGDRRLCALRGVRARGRGCGCGVWVSVTCDCRSSQVRQSFGLLVTGSGRNGGPRTQQRNFVLRVPVFLCVCAGARVRAAASWPSSSRQRSAGVHPHEPRSASLPVWISGSPAGPLKPWVDPCERWVRLNLFPASRRVRRPGAPIATLLRLPRSPHPAFGPSISMIVKSRFVVIGFLRQGHGLARHTRRCCSAAQPLLQACKPASLQVCKPACPPTIERACDPAMPIPGVAPDHTDRQLGQLGQLGLLDRQAETTPLQHVAATG